VRQDCGITKYPPNFVSKARAKAIPVNRKNCLSADRIEISIAVSQMNWLIIRFCHVVSPHNSTINHFG